MAKVLVTGGAGYTGILLTEKLLGGGHHVCVVDNFMFGYEPILHLASHPRLEVIKRDVRHEDMSYVAGKDVVFHLAAISGYPACEANPHSAQTINVTATQRLAGTLSRDQFLIFASTTSFYGSSGGRSTEETAIKPVSLYGLTKQSGEKAVMQRELSISLRWATVFGVSPRMRAGLLVNDFVEKAINEHSIILYDADSKRTFMHVNDLVRGYLFAMENRDAMKGGVYNMGSERLNFTKRQIAAKIKERVPCEIMESSMGDVDIRNFEVSFEKAKKLGFDCQQSLEDGILELVRLYRFYTPFSFVKPI
jgi:nucleoside-diphosphate-sugar epimerase